MSLFKQYYKLLLLYVAFIIITKVLFYFYLRDNFSELSWQASIYAIFWGHKFDFAVAALLSFIASLFDFNKKAYAFVSTLFLILIVNIQIGDMLYFSESGRHVGYEIFDIFVDMKSLLLTAYSQHFFLTLTTLILSTIVFVIGFSQWKTVVVTQFNRYYIPKKVILLIMSIFFIRGMSVQGIPLNPWQAGQLANNKQAILALNASYSVVFALTNKNKAIHQLPIPNVTKNIANQSLKALYADKNTKIDTPILTSKPNVVMLFLESWSAKYMQPYGYQNSTTPYFDTILKQSIRPRAMIAGGHRTSEGMFATLSSMQNPLGRTIAKTPLQDIKHPSIVDDLNKIGYSSAFFQGTSKETSGVGSFAQSLGFVESFGKRDIKNTQYPRNNWGVQDYDLYQFALTHIQSMSSPFVIGINGATTHDLVVPDEFLSQHFSDDKDLNTMLNTYRFADFSLEYFIKAVKSKHPNTVFILFADHTGSRISDNLENYLIPFAIYAPNILPAQYKDVVMSQRDIAPSLYDLIIGDYTKTQFSGKSIFRDAYYFADYFHNNILGWIEAEDIVEINIQTGDFLCFKLNFLQKQAVKCENKHDDLKNHALSFTAYRQNLLFNATNK
ncbi:Phosphoglycerol transferase I [Bathymodiolus thermophilus thioautotrophic gill symbiont]|uniref:LTA synthase family protein n=1 Tax=Bathymodiolus thermophilus thioautotrophic gill symbiont TaxID=2360 RepID=UPI0010BA0735|nr:alkaline phosphatase family protein [Bathymodiolus thermophilus thioautotrophic gill symbiont]SHA15454.1 Phosphoglycerol transferase I [Bathymodiolus thermophilus thioautotrophic gill symbiont]